MDKALYSERDVEIVLKLPVLTVVPILDLAMSRARRREPSHPGTHDAPLELKA
jgi:hypothetical protein